jgi:hypothetical protein
MANKLKLKIKPEQFSLFISKLEEIASIDDTVKLKIDSDDILMYSMLGGNVLLAYKNFLLPTKDFFDLGDVDYKIDLIIPNAKKFVKNMAFIKDMDKINFDITYKPSPDDSDLYIVRSLHISSGKFKVNWLGGEGYEVRDIDKHTLSQRLDLRNKKWSFTIGTSDYLDIKKLSNINSEKIINMNVVNGIVTLSEVSSWELEIDKLDDITRNANLILNKRFLSCIDDKKDITFNIFDNFMLIKEDNSNLMLSFEQSFSDD